MTGVWANELCGTLVAAVAPLTRLAPVLALREDEESPGARPAPEGSFVEPLMEPFLEPFLEPLVAEPEDSRTLCSFLPSSSVLD
jgi:hypothetical protein